MGLTYLAWGAFDAAREPAVRAGLGRLHRAALAADGAAAAVAFPTEPAAVSAAAVEAAEELARLAGEAGRPCGILAGTARFHLADLRGPALLVEHHEGVAFGAAHRARVERVAERLRALLVALGGRSCGSGHLD